ncbi:MAG: UDP-2,3-diacylglucosamine diphosphatase [Cyclobacteriaceae bacterium]|nr:UDP-2,3-diacylglucosamine diphosphatase [Cyclobacteriaceae bacterium]MCH8516652.1 UDP-2,3-diacylglucosamine diphosphatase [Cyclobacteriaceae bacterium]
MGRNITEVEFNFSKGQLYFASDFHLGAPNPERSLTREREIIRWLEEVSKDAAAIFLQGDIFDFWFEYKKVIPKGFVRFQAKVAELTDAGIPVIFFVGNHDLWMKDYFQQELGVSVYHDPIQFKHQGKKFVLGHGDGLGPGDHTYKLLKKVFKNPFLKWLFGWLHPNIGVGLAHYWSSKSRLKHSGEEIFLGEDEWLWQWCKQNHPILDADYYIFGHRHLPLELEVGASSKYINLGQWVSQYYYAQFNDNQLSLIQWKHKI